MTIQKIKDLAIDYSTWWFDDKEKGKIKQAIEALSPKEYFRFQEELNKIEDDKCSATEQICWQTKIDLQELMEQTKPLWFERLWDELERNEVISDLHDAFSSYLDARLWKWFEPPFTRAEKDAIWLVLFDKFLDSFSSEWLMGRAVDLVWDRLKKILSPLSKLMSSKEWENSEDDKRSLEDAVNDIWETVDEIRDIFSSWTEEDKRWLLDYGDMLVWWKEIFEKLHKKKQTGENLTDPIKVREILEAKKEEWSNKDSLYGSIRTKAEELEANLKWKRNDWRQLASLLGQLDEWLNNSKLFKKLFWEDFSIKKFISEFVEKHPFIWFILSIFLWPEFLDWFLSWESAKEKKCVEWLKSYMWDNDKWGKLWFWWKLWDWAFESIIKDNKLKSFFDYLKSKWIDYEKEWLWEAIFTWITDSSKLKQIHELLSYGLESDKKIFEANDFENNWKWFIDKLNWLAEKEKQKVDKEKTSTSAWLAGLSWLWEWAEVPAGAEGPAEWAEWTEVPAGAEGPAEWAEWTEVPAGAEGPAEWAEWTEVPAGAEESVLLQKLNETSLESFLDPDFDISRYSSIDINSYNVAKIRDTFILIYNNPRYKLVFQNLQITTVWLLVSKFSDIESAIKSIDDPNILLNQISGLSSLPWKINYAWKEYSLSISGWTKINIWWQDYSIALNYGKNRFVSISFSNWFIIEYEWMFSNSKATLKPQLLARIFISIVTNGKFDSKETFDWYDVGVLLEKPT